MHGIGLAVTCVQYETARQLARFTGGLFLEHGGKAASRAFTCAFASVFAFPFDCKCCHIRAHM
eukprot:1145397-Pelagomonas_calceolata.AAC.3